MNDDYLKMFENCDRCFCATVTAVNLNKLQQRMGYAKRKQKLKEYMKVERKLFCFPPTRF